MADAYKHSLSSAAKFGGVAEDYYHIHAWIDGSKSHYADVRHRALRHHTLGIADAIDKFGPYILLADGQKVMTRQVCEQHMMEDFNGKIPTVEDWCKSIEMQPWMIRSIRTFTKT